LGATCTIVEGAGHGLTEEVPSRVEDAVRELAAAVGRGSSNRT
jgi:hypothetical protein